MSDKVIKITSQQGFAEKWATTASPQTLHLCDFTIPRGMSIDLSKSYISWNTQIHSNTEHPINAGFWLTTDTAEEINVPTAALVRNAHIQNDRGMVESIRRADTLTTGLWAMTNSAESRKNDMNTLACYEDGRGIGNKTSYNLDAVTDNTAPNGTAVNTLHVSKDLSRDLKVPLKDIFGIGNTEEYSTDIFGESRIHIETNFKHLKAKHLNGNELTDLMFDETTAYGTMVNNPALADAAEFGPVVESAGTYDDWQYVCPFFTGQKVIVEYSVDAGASYVISAANVIKSMKFQNDNTATPPTGGSKVFFTLNANVYTNTSGGAQNVLVRMYADTSAVLSLVVNRAELVLYTIPASPDMPTSLTYPTYTTEEDNGNSLTSFNKQYMLEPESDAVLVAICNNGAILPSRGVKSYRYAIDQEEQTGNRDIPMNTAGDVQTSPLQADRLQRCLEQQIGVGWRNAQMRFYKQNEPPLGAYLTPVSMICETVEPKATSKMLNLNIESATAIQQLVLYKHIMKTI